MKGFKSQSSRRILHNFRGTIGVGEMLLVIGKPGSGCTTFLKTLANMHEEYKHVTGNVIYGGIPAEEMGAKFSQDIIFCGQWNKFILIILLADMLFQPRMMITFPLLR